MTNQIQKYCDKYGLPYYTIGGRKTPQCVKSYAEEYSGQACTLEGEPAKITGRFNQFATVGQIDGPLAVEFRWDTIRRVMNLGGNFQAK